MSTGSAHAGRWAVPHICTGTGSPQSHLRRDFMATAPRDRRVTAEKQRAAAGRRAKANPKHSRRAAILFGCGRRQRRVSCKRHQTGGCAVDWIGSVVTRACAAPPWPQPAGAGVGLAGCAGGRTARLAARNDERRPCGRRDRTDGARARRCRAAQSSRLQRTTACCNAVVATQYSMLQRSCRNAVQHVATQLSQRSTACRRCKDGGQG